MLSIISSKTFFGYEVSPVVKAASNGTNIAVYNKRITVIKFIVFANFELGITINGRA